MKTIYVILYLTHLSLAQESVLELVQVFFRHGARTPEYTDVYPNDPYTLKDFLPMGYGQLTNIGKSQAYQLGIQLRDRYNSFLGDLYTPGALLVTTTDYDRTKTTAMLVAAGLYPPTMLQQWDPSVYFNPIPYNGDRANYDYFLRRPTWYCPRYVKELHKIERSTMMARVLKENQADMEYISKETGLKMRSLMDVFKIYQTLCAEENMNFTLPQWTDSVYSTTITNLAGMQCKFENYNTWLKRLNGGRSLQRVIANMKNKIIKHKPESKMYLYSGHENNVINVLAALNLFQPHVVHYCASVTLELHYLPNDESYAVKILYSKSSNSTAEPLVLDGCTILCPFDKFLSITEPVVPVNYTTECESPFNLDI